MIQMDDRQEQTSPSITSPQTGILHSSESLGWKGIVVEHRYHPAGEYVFPASYSHMIGLHLGPPLSVEQVRNGQTRTDMLTYGTVKIVPSGTESIWRHRDGANHMHLLLAPALFQHVGTDKAYHHIELLEQFSINDPRIEHICLALLTEVLEGGGTGQLYAESLAIALASHLLHSYNNTPQPRHLLSEKFSKLPEPLLQSITSFIEDRLSENLSLVELASEFGLSPSHFSNLFRNTMGLSPHRYIVQRRLEHAQCLLRSTRLSIGEIATTVGFYDQSHLVRHMQRAMGVTPTYIREHP